MWDLSSVWLSFVYTGGILVIMFLLSKILAQQPATLNIRDNKNGHRWSLNKFVIDFPLHCNACETFLFTATGQCCIVCGAASCANNKCVRTVDRKTTCKSVSRSKTAEEARTKLSAERKHRWVLGNLPLDSICCVCEDPAGDGPGLKDYQCIWCQRKVHTDCKPDSPNSCDLGRFRNMVVPPESVVVRTGRTIRKNVISSLVLPSNVESSPLIVVGNQKSGNSDCANILAAFRRQLNPSQVIDLSEGRMEDVLEWCQLASPVRCTILVCGGDGTVGWLLNTAHKLGPSTEPLVAIFPLGTGNDLARTLGYGSGSDSSENIIEFVSKLERGQPVKLDRWKVEVAPKRHLRIRLPKTTLLMNNYLSIGVDALVTYNFHKARESPFYLFSSRIINKLIYFSYGTKDVLERQCQNLNEKLNLYLDGEKIDLPNIESVVVLNIPYWGAGCKPWTLGNGAKEFEFEQDYCDKKLEVFCIYSSFHIAQMQVGLSEPHRVGQAETVRIELSKSVPLQIDGEPWEQHPAVITINHSAQVSMLKIAK
eukprot:TRINITY_DN34740_c0_g1_i2.p1 TRINITY_DN34740_c0_g1~~TRINITY_DN34740_c0_g1_i2.p1  ORF type:complete len:537 (+),score=42.44 TRINITY_DN34740_c0_g1_i2:89-1699(+)